MSFDVDVNAMFEFDVDADLAIAEESAKVTAYKVLPKGWYYTTPPAKRHETTLREKGIYSGRVTTDFWMPVVQAEADDEDNALTGYVSIEFSPVNGLYQGKPDSATFLRSQAVKAFIATREEKPTSYDEVVEFLATEPVMVRLGIRKGKDNYPDRNAVYEIKGIAL